MLAPMALMTYMLLITSFLLVWAADAPCLQRVVSEPKETPTVAWITVELGTGAAPGPLRLPVERDAAPALYAHVTKFLDARARATHNHNPAWSW